MTSVFSWQNSISLCPASFCTAAAAAAKSLQSCPTVRPHRQQPTRLPRPWDSPGKNTGVGCHFLLRCMKVKIESDIAQWCPTLSDPMDCSPPGSSFHGIFQATVLSFQNFLNLSSFGPSAIVWKPGQEMLLSYSDRKAGLWLTLPLKRLK